MTVLSCIIAAILLPFLSLDIFGGLGDYRLLFFLMYVASAFQGFFGFVARGLNQIKLIPVSSVVSSLASGGLAFLLIGPLHMGVDGYFYSVIIGATLGCLIFLVGGRQYRCIHIVKTSRDMPFLRKMLAYSLPLVPNALSWWINSNVNRYFIIGMLGIATSGLFAAACKIPNIINLLSQIFLSAWTLSAFQEFKQDNVEKFFAIIFKLFHAMGSIFASLLIVLTPWVASLMLQKEFFQAWPLVPLMVVAVLYNILSSFFASLYTSSMKTMFLFITTAVGAIVTMVATPLLIWTCGVIGTSLAMLLGNLAVLLMRATNSRKIMRFPVNWASVLLTQVALLAQASLMTWDHEGGVVLVYLLAALVVAVQCVQLLPVARHVIGYMKNRKAVTQ